VLEWEGLFVVHFVILGANVLWEDGDFAVVEVHRIESGVFPAKTVLWPNLVPSWVAPLEVCMGITMVTGYGHVLWGLAVSHVVVEMPPALGRCPLQRGVHWLRWRPHKIHCGGHRVLGG
jgi:hypothetical protein